MLRSFPVKSSSPFQSSGKRTRSIMHAHLTASPASYTQQMKLLTASPAPHFVLFSSDLNEASLPWCPDCVRSLPEVIEAVDRVQGSLLEVRVGTKEAWRMPSHPFRTDAKLLLKGIPTLFFCKPDGELIRAGPELEQASSSKEAAQIISDFIKSISE